MVPHFKYTYRQIINEAMLLIEPYINIYNFDTSTIINQLIMAMRNMVYSLIPLKLWAFKNTVAIKHRSVVPLDFVKDIALVIQGDDANDFVVEARRVNFREYYQLWNWENCHHWNFARLLQPIYTFAGEPNVENRRMLIYIAPNNDFFNGGLPNFYSILEMPVGLLRGILEYYSVPSTLFTLDSELPFPDEFAELLVLDLCIRFLSYSADPYKIINLHRDILEKRRNLWNTFASQVIQERKEMDIFVEPTPPVSDLPPIKGEMENELT